jgi:hypothetical protein
MEEMAAKLANRECYYYPEKYIGDHKCPVKGVFLLEIDDDVAEEAVEELGISLHALTGIDVGETMKLQITIGGTPLVALVDTGSTHTFIKEEVATQLGLWVECPSRWPMGSVSVATGSVPSYRSPSTRKISTSASPSSH